LAAPPESLHDRIKTALDESRIMILGGQVLLGFQFHGVFADAFGTLPRHALIAQGVAMGLMFVAIGAMVTPSAYHRLALDGTDTGTLHSVIGWFTGAALPPFALSLGVDIFIVTERMAGTAVGTAAGCTFACLALAAWFGAGYLARQRVGGMERQAAAARAAGVEDTPLHARIEQMLTEARVVLPGAQTLFGFQLAIVLTREFEKVPASSRLCHGLALGCVALSVILLMAPAAYHRIVYAGMDTLAFLRIGGRLVTAAMAPLALGLAGEAYVVFARISGSAAFGMAAAGVTFAMLAGLWYAFPIAARRRVNRGA